LIETTELLSLFLLLWKNLVAHCAHFSLTDFPTKQSENSETSQLLCSSETSEKSENSSVVVSIVL